MLEFCLNQKYNQLMKRMFYIITILITFSFFGCTKDSSKDSVCIGVFVPGIVSGSPVYEMLVNGVDEAITNHNKDPNAQLVEMFVIEAGTNQAEWATKMTAIVSSGMYDLIISSNPSLPDLVEPLTHQFPNQKFIILDGYLQNNPSIKTIRYNQREQAWMSGYMAALVTTASKEQMPLSNPQKKIALIAAQEYPVMNNVIFPAFVEGAKAHDKDIKVEFRLVGNWYDATKAANIAHSLYVSDVDVILPICGGASQGVISQAKELGFYITWFDDNGFEKAPGNIISSSAVMQKKLANEVICEYLEGKTEFGTASTVGIKDGYVSFIQDDPLYIQYVDESIRKKITQKYEEIKSGVLSLPTP